MQVYVHSSKDKIMYDPSTGYIYRLFKTGWRRTGRAINSAGYHFAQYCGKIVPVHQIIRDLLGWTGIIDHIDKDRTNNRMSNLRCVSEKVNRHNRSNTKHRKLPVGVRWTGHAFQARIRVDGKLQTLGSYTSVEAAITAYNIAKQSIMEEI